MSVIPFDSKARRRDLAASCIHWSDRATDGAGCGRDHVGVRHDRLLNLAELDAEAVHLDLRVLRSMLAVGAFDWAEPTALSRTPRQRRTSGPN